MNLIKIFFFIQFTEIEKSIKKIDRHIVLTNLEYQELIYSNLKDEYVAKKNKYNNDTLNVEVNFLILNNFLIYLKYNY